MASTFRLHARRLPQVETTRAATERRLILITFSFVASSPHHRNPPQSMLPSATMEKEESSSYHLQPTTNWFTKPISFQADIMHNSRNTLFSPLTFFFSLAFDSYHRAEEKTSTVGSAVLNVPYKLTNVSTSVLRKIGMGIVGAVHVSIVLTMLMLLAVLLGVGLVQLLVEEPVFLKERLFFDYTEVNPHATINLYDVGVKQRQMSIPAGHTIHVSLMLLVPESDYNRQLGVFQVNAEILSGNNNVMAKSSQPCMLRYRSLPIRVFRTFVMGMPLVLGFIQETQTLRIDLLKHKEAGGVSRTKSIRVILIPRAWTSQVPQVYEAELHIKSQLPWTKQMVRNWKWTFCVWTSLYIYMFLLIVLLCCCKPLIFPVPSASSTPSYGDGRAEAEEEISYERRDFQEMLRTWQQRRKKRKTLLGMHGLDLTETDVGTSVSSVSTFTFTRDDASSVVEEEDCGDSASVCLDGSSSSVLGL